jgi:hypothetical protein
MLHEVAGLRQVMQVHEVVHVDDSVDPVRDLGTIQVGCCCWCGKGQGFCLHRMLHVAGFRQDNGDNRWVHVDDSLDSVRDLETLQVG